jgi:hypothetical protein
VRAASVLLCALAVGGALAPGRAAADEKEFLLALQPGFAFAKVGDRTAWGGGGGLDLAYGVTDALAVRLTGAYSGHALGAGDKNVPPGGLLTAFHAGAGVTYAVDIVRLVPFFDLSVGLLGMTLPALKGQKTCGGSTANADGTALCLDFGVEIGVGADYLINRHVAIGFVVRYHAFVTSITDIPVYLYAGPRLAFRFGL